MKIIIKTFAAMLCCSVVMTSMSSCTTKNTEDTENSEEEIQTTYKTVIEELHCTSGDIDIYGLLYAPEGKEGPLPAIVLSHSSSPLLTQLWLLTRNILPNKAMLHIALTSVGPARRAGAREGLPRK